MLTSPWIAKPPPGWPLNQAHPLAVNLDLLVAFNESAGKPYDLVTGNQLNTSNFAWGGAPTGPAGVFNGTSTDVTTSAGGGVEKWVVPTSTRVSVMVRALSTNGLTTPGSALMERENVNATWLLFFESGNIRWRGSSAVPDRGCAAALSGTNYANNKWITYVATDDGATARLYMDGMQVATGTSGMGPAANAKPIHFGNYDASNYWLSGAIDVGAVWSRALTPSEVLSISVNPWQVVAPPSDYWWMGSPSASIFNPAWASPQPVLGVGVY